MSIRSIKVGDYESRFTKVRLFICDVNQNPRAFRSTILPKALKKLKIPQKTKAVWNRYAGCSCGCSPGFILDLSCEKFGNQAIWVHLR